MTKQKLHDLATQFTKPEDLDYDLPYGVQELAAAYLCQEAALQSFRLVIQAVLLDAKLEDDYEKRDSAGRFIRKGALLDLRDALAQESEL